MSTKLSKLLWNYSESPHLRLVLTQNLLLLVLIAVHRQHCCTRVPDVSVATQAERPHQLLSLDACSRDDSAAYFYTGLENYSKVKFVLATLCLASKCLKYIYGPVSVISVIDQFVWFRSLNCVSTTLISNWASFLVFLWHVYKYIYKYNTIYFVLWCASCLCSGLYQTISAVWGVWIDIN